MTTQKREWGERHRERERGKERRQRRNELRAVKQPEAEIPSGYLSQRALPFPRAESRRTTREREREDLALNGFPPWPYFPLTASHPRSNRRMERSWKLLLFRDVRSEITVLELPFK